ncbi:MAG: hypothetical protein HY689_15460 [Chloroflexi bacterium]|nr:hypothetical protein [Chloroflexota bacterium]
MMVTPSNSPAPVGGRGDAAGLPPPPGQDTVVLAALTVGVLLMGIQLWLLTIALDLYLGGQGDRVWQLALASGLIFLGGLLVLWVLGRRPRLRPLPPGEARYRSGE